MKSAGGLQLPDDDAQDYLAALEFYGLEKSSTFLRRCARQLIKHAKAGDKLALPLDFELARNPKSHC